MGDLEMWSPVPTYCYKLPTGRIVEKQAPMRRIPRFIRIDGSVATRCHAAELGAVVGTTKTHARVSDNYGVNPRQVPELQRLLKSRGVRDTQFTETGACVVQDRTHGNEMMKARGMKNLDAGYGDWNGK